MEYQIDLNKLIEAAAEKQLEITIHLEPDRKEVTIQPWKPFEYKCPYGAKNE